ncbi:MAG: L-glutamine synthetase [Thermoanaerobacterales bacterium 50_218]|nr:MAG: L-glutamine synthetase [Thermoanaerobacterales bacterium 50_218]HAA90334.1 type I glutamate--ammonia ligase [Peptococcaceae bacterium]
MFKNYEEMRKFCEENDVKMIDFKMIDPVGRWRHLTIPVERFTPRVLEEGIAFDGSSYGYLPLEKSDMIFIPDLSTAFMDPFWELPTLSMIGDIYYCGEPPRPFEQDPRGIARKALEYMKQTGIADQMIIGPEFEFYIFDHVSYENLPQRAFFEIDSEEAFWNSGDNSGVNLGYKNPPKGGYHMPAPWDAVQDLRSEMCLLLEERGVPIKYHHHEVGGPGQVEIEIELGPMLEWADKTMLIKYFAKNVAIQRGRTVTFMPKPIYGEAGNGMHIHMLLMKNGQPIFYDPNGYSGLSQTALYAIGGVLKHAPALAALTNPSTNSYKRLVPGYEAPVSICFATANRSAVIRIPAYANRPEQKRFEFRCPDATCNPYLAYAALLMAALDGIENKIDPVAEGFGPYDVNLYNLPEEEKKKIKALPTSLEGALKALEEDHDFLLKGDVFPKRLIETWISIKMKEAALVSQFPHPQEFFLYYDL